MSTFSKDDFIERLRKVRESGWICCARPGNAGGVGNTLEDLLGIQENNLPMADAGEWELKAQRSNTSALTTLFHMEPAPRAQRLVPQMLLPRYGWPHQSAGAVYPAGERSFRQTIGAGGRSDRGFGVRVDRDRRQVVVSFSSTQARERHAKWCAEVVANAGPGELDPQPYWSFDELFEKAKRKLRNCFYVVADVQFQEGKQYYRYSNIQMLEGLSLERFVGAIEQGDVLVDFDARTGHNHGTKFRLRQGGLAALYDRVTKL